MGPSAKKTRLGWRILPNVVAFAIGLSAAYFLNWKTADLVWSLWLCSLVLGYTTLFSAIFGGAFVGLYWVSREKLQWWQRFPAIVAGLVGAILLFGFFSLHFCGFHAGHSVFLAQFFPIAGIPKDGFGDAFMNPPLLWRMVFEHLMIAYGIFLIPALIAERKYVFQPIVTAVKELRSQRQARRDEEHGEKRTPQKSSHDSFAAMGMFRPYINVVRMHLLIFFFAFCHFLNVASFAVYTVVYCVYFFPWSELQRTKNLSSTTTTAW